ncbi:amidohydrolase family protein [Pseudonocardia halophobica]|uniref:Amidohydrolase n=1 Tax=Pseudonocardia halophobica TaxID=29401 RepID=A0A9W6NZR7_9PSEU|nr:amidohydrolase family protein [Pseudonocardia halophobica]GLL15179.1 amidohydrolase [Pseudonocardia halophobica]
MTTTLHDVRVFDGERLREPGTVTIEGGLIGHGAAGPGTEVDGRGGVLLPGLIDAHVHLLGPDDLTALAGHGVTTALDMACWPAERVDSFRGRIPDIRSAGTPAIGAGGTHARMPGMPADAVLRAADQAEPFVAARVAEGADYIKVVIEWPGPDLLDQPTIDAVAAAARAHGMLSVAHASSVAAYRMAVHAGVDVVTHVPRDGVIDAETIARMAEAGTAAVPTLAMMEAVVAQFGRPGEAYAYSRDSVAALHAAGVPVLAGTDAFSGPMLPDPVRHGVSLHRELMLLVEAGLTPAEALRAATALPARYFDLGDRGAIAPGLRADLVLLADDPLADISATRGVQRVWCGGVEVEKVLL